MTNVRDDRRSVLESYFSAPIAKAIVGAASKAAARAGHEDTPQWELAFDRELQRLLQVYLPDAERRLECLARIVPRVRMAAPIVTPSASPAARPVSGAYERPALSHQPSAGYGRRASETRLAQSVRPAALGTASTSVVVRDQSDIPNACEVVRDLGRKLGFSRVDQTKMATAVSELARNMLQYAGGGTIRFAEVLAPRRGLEAFFEDHGPGIVGLDDMLEAGSMGLGLRGSRGIADEFTIDTQPGDGTRITMRKYVA